MHCSCSPGIFTTWNCDRLVYIFFLFFFFAQSFLLCTIVLVCEGGDKHGRNPTTTKDSHRTRWRADAAPQPPKEETQKPGRRRADIILNIILLGVIRFHLPIPLKKGLPFWLIFAGNIAQSQLSQAYVHMRVLFSQRPQKSLLPSSFSAWRARLKRSKETTCKRQ